MALRTFAHKHNQAFYSFCFDLASVCLLYFGDRLKSRTHTHILICRTGMNPNIDISKHSKQKLRALKFKWMIYLIWLNFSNGDIFNKSKPNVNKRNASVYKHFRLYHNILMPLGNWIDDLRRVTWIQIICKYNIKRLSPIRLNGLSALWYFGYYANACIFFEAFKFIAQNMKLNKTHRDDVDCLIWFPNGQWNSNVIN